MKTLITIVCMVFAFAATAGERMIQHSTKLHTDTFTSKQEAINAGFNMYDSLANATNDQLRWKLNPADQEVISRSMNLESAQVRIEDIPVSRGTMHYRAVVDVDYNYRIKENNN